MKDLNSQLQSLVQKLREINLLRGIETISISSDQNCMLPIYFSNAEISDKRAMTAGVEDCQAHYGSGESFDKEQSRVSAVAEALEGYCSDNLTNSKEIVCSIAELDCRFIDPVDAGLYAEQQYEYLEFDKFDSNAPLGWILGQSVTQSDSVYVPALSVYLNYTPSDYEQVLFQPGSTGLATGSSLPQAILNGLYEVIERDAFLITWLNKLSGRALVTDQSSRISPYIERLKRDKFTVKLFSLSTDSNCRVVICILIKEVGGKYSTFVGLGADLDLYYACEKCIFEAMRAVVTHSEESSSPEIQKRIAQLNTGKFSVTEMEDHGWYYIKRDSVNEFDFLDQSSSEELLVKGPQNINFSHEQKMDQLVSGFRKGHSEVIYVDLTTTDLKEIGVYVVRVVLPGFQPMYHGEQFRRLGTKRLFDYPVNQGFFVTSKKQSLLNTDPHPLG